MIASRTNSWSDVAHLAKDAAVPDTIADMLSLGRNALAQRSENPRLDGELLLAAILKVDRSRLYAHPEGPVSATQRADFARLLARRAKGEPLAYLTGEKEFWSLSLRVSPDTLIPRPETERLVELALERAGPNSRIVDLGTGSGAIAIAIAREMPGTTLVATDASRSALALARANAKTHGADNIEFRLAALGDWFGVLDDERFNLIISNPPYVCAEDPAFETDDIRFEPRLALASGQDGLDALRQIVANASGWLEPGGWLLVEHGNAQGESARRLFAAAGYSKVETRHDLAGHERITLGQASP